MIRIFQNLETRREHISIAIVFLGLGSVLVILLTAPLDEPTVWDPMQSKPYLRQLETIGGQSAVAGAELQQWFSSLWHGERLAFTVAFITLVVLFVYRFLSAPLPRETGTLDDIRQGRAP